VRLLRQRIRTGLGDLCILVGGGAGHTDRADDLAVHHEDRRVRLVLGGFDATQLGAEAVLIRERVDALTATENPLNVEPKDLIVSFATKNHLPTVFGERVLVDAGGVMSYGISFADLLRRVATCMDKILKGAKPSDLRVEQPTKFELVINLKTAKSI
jgi:ABC transporter substrate binding protein